MFRLLRNVYGDIHLLGAPIHEEDQQKFIDDIKVRLSKQPEEASVFMERWIDRITSKAVGILQYNAVVLVLTVWLSTNMQQNTINKFITSASCIFSLISSILMMLIMHSHWGKHAYSDPWKDFETSAYLTMYRSILLMIGLSCGAIAALLVILFLIIS